MVAKSMAAGTQGVSRRRDYSNYSRKEYDHYGSGVLAVKLNRGRNHGVGNRNSWDYSLNNNHSGHRRDGYCDRREDSGYVHSFESRIGNGRDVSKFEDGEEWRLEKRRKLSPIVWDKEEKEVRLLSKNRVVPNAFPARGMTLSSVKLPEAMEVTTSKSPEDLSRFHDVEGNKVGDRELDQQHNISMSRWASESDSDDDDMLRTKELAQHMDASKTPVDGQMSSPESGEYRREGSEVGDKERSSGSDEGGRFLRLSNGEDYSNDELDSSENEKHNGDVGVNQFRSDSGYESDSYQNEEPVVPTQRNVNMLQGCRSVFEYQQLGKINEGTYGIVYRARDKKTDEIVALKMVKMGREKEGFPMSALREMNILLSLDHPSVVIVKEVVMGDLDKVFMVMEYMEHDLKEQMGVMKQPFSTSEVKCLMLQLLEGVKYLHENWVLHRDLKSSNILLNNRGELKICDFGMSRQYGSPLKPFTPLVVTLWYRAPEILLGAKQYSTAIDMWSVGCIMAEMLAKKPLFDGKTEIEQLDKIFRTLGTPNNTRWPGFSELPGSKAKFVKQPYNLLREKFPATSFTGSPVLSASGLDLLNKLLTYNPEQRITAEDALNHPWFREVPLPKSKDLMPTFPPKNAKTGI